MYIYSHTLMYCPGFRESSLSIFASYPFVTLATSGFTCDVTDTSEAILVREGEGERGTDGEAGRAPSDWCG